MRLRTLSNTMNLTGKRVLLRVDVNVPVEKGKAVDGPHGRIARAAVAIDWLLQRGARVVVMAHLGRPGGRKHAAYSLRPVAKRLSELLHMNVRLARGITGEHIISQVNRLKDGKVLLLENLRFDPREEANDPELAKELALLGDLYINDAFANSHRAHASMDAITHELPSYAGHGLMQEVRELSELMKKPRKPFVLAMGGLKMKTKLPVMEAMLPHVDAILCGGALASTFLLAAGHNIGTSVYVEEEVEEARAFLKRAGDKLLLPTDVHVVKQIRKDARMESCPVDAVEDGYRIVDVGPASMELFVSHIRRAKTILWNGPFGYCEMERFCAGTHLLAQEIADQTGRATTIVGGGDTVPAVDRANQSNKYTLMSTGGGAMLAFLSGAPLPALEALRSD